MIFSSLCNKASGNLQASDVIEYLGAVDINSAQFVMEGGGRRTEGLGFWFKVNSLPPINLFSILK